MTGKYMVFTIPGDSSVALLHDSGPSFVGVPSQSQGRPGFLIAIDQNIPDGQGAQLVVEREGFTPFNVRGILWLSRLGPDDMASFDVDDVRLTANPNKPLPRLVRDRHVFRLATGERFTAIEASFFNGLARFMREGPHAIMPQAQQLKDFGFNMVRTWTLMQLSQFGIGDITLAEFPQLYSEVPKYVQFMARYGLYVEFTAYTSLRDPQHWNRLTEACQSTPWALAELVNENNVPANTIDPNAYQSKPWMNCSHGSNGSGSEAVRPPWDYETFHTNGQAEEQRKIGHNAMELYDGAGDWAPGGRPVITNETSRCPQVGMWTGASPAQAVQRAYDSAAGAALLCAGSCFHSVQGKKAALLEGIEATAGQAWAQGARSVPLHYQHGQYIRLAPMPGTLRVYQRRVGDDAWTVTIRE